MKNTKHCSFRTFWLGFSDWWGSRMSMTHGEAILEVRERHSPRILLKLLGVASALVLALFIGVFAAPTLVRYSAATGVTSRHVLFASQWGTLFTVVAVTGAVLILKIRQFIRFSHEMCKRGQSIEIARSGAPFSPQ